MSAVFCSPLEALVALTPAGWGNIRRSASILDIAMTSGCSQAVVAVEMRRAVNNGYAAKAGPRTIPQTWTATGRGERFVAEHGGPPEGLELVRVPMTVDGRVAA